jgi:PAS domain S-box-containing protein
MEAPTRTVMADFHHQTRILKFWKRLTEPDSSIQDPEQRQQAQFLASLFLILSPVGIVSVLLPALSRHEDLLARQSLYVYFLGSLVAAIAYFVSRTKWYKVAAWGAVVGSSLAIFLSVIVDLTPQDSSGLFYLIIPMLLSGILLTLRAASLFALLQIATIMALPLLIDGVTWQDTIAYPLGFNLIAALVILLVARHRTLAERERQSGLEARIAMRTEELTRLNQNLKEQVSEREQAEQALAEERNLLRTLIDILPDEIYVKDNNSRFLLVNSTWAKNNAHSEAVSAAIGKSDYDFFAHDLADEFSADERRLIETGEPLVNKEEINLRQADDQRWMQTTKVPLRNPAGRVVGLVGISRNITQRKQIEDSLRKAREELERRVVERTEELSHANTELQRQVKERLQVEDQLRYQANLLQNINDAIISTSPKFIIQTWNQAAEQIYGWSAEEAIGQHVDKLLDAAFPFHTPEEVHALFAQNGYWHGEVAHKRKDSSTVHVLSSVTLVHDVSGVVIGVVGVNRDITEHKLAEIAEREQRLLAEALRDTAAAINSTLDFREVLDRILIQVERVVPYDSANIMLIEGASVRVVHCRGYVERGFDLEDVLALRFPLYGTENLLYMYETGEPFLVSDTHEYPHWRHVEPTTWIKSSIGAPIRIEADVIGFINLDNARAQAFTQIHAETLQTFANQAAVAIQNARLYDAVKDYAMGLEVRVAERTAQLERQRAQLQTILDSMHEGVVGIMYGQDMQPQTRLMNRAMVTLAGYTPEEWDFNLLRSHDTTEAEAEQTIEAYQHAIQTVGFWQIQAKIRRKDGSEFDGNLTVTRVNDLDGKMIGVVIVTRDISQEKLLQEQRSRFVANASHELRTPITNMLTRLYLLRKQPERLNDHLEILENVAGRMRDLVEDLLEHSRFERGVIPLRLQEMDLRPIIMDVIRVQQAEADIKHISITCQIPEIPIRVLADQGRIIQVFTNLVTNAINYTPDGGRVRVECLVEQDESASDRVVVVHVQDSGIGIPPDMLLNIFRPFYRGSEQTKGTGLGLSIAKEIVEMHAGTIIVESQFGQGSRFTVRLGVIAPSV